jgi:hypothetical protein
MPHHLCPPLYALAPVISSPVSNMSSRRKRLTDVIDKVVAEKRQKSLMNECNKVAHTAVNDNVPADVYRCLLCACTCASADDIVKHLLHAHPGILAIVKRPLVNATDATCLLLFYIRFKTFPLQPPLHCPHRWQRTFRRYRAPVKICTPCTPT